MQRVTLLIIFIAMSSFGAGVLISNSDIIGGLSLFGENRCGDDFEYNGQCYSTSYKAITCENSRRFIFDIEGSSLGATFFCPDGKFKGVHRRIKVTASKIEFLGYELDRRTLSLVDNKTGSTVQCELADVEKIYKSEVEACERKQAERKI